MVRVIYFVLEGKIQEDKQLFKIYSELIEHIANYVRMEETRKVNI